MRLLGLLPFAMLCACASDAGVRPGSEGTAGSAGMVGSGGSSAAAGSSASAGSSAGGSASANQTGSWVPVDHGHQAIWMKAAPNVNRVYLSDTTEKRLFVTEDDGGTWTPLANTTTDGKAVDAHFLEMIFDPTDATDSTFWVTGMYGAVGVYYTSDGGQTFASTCFSHMETSSVDLTDPARSTILGADHGGTLILSKDGGKTCAPILSKVQAADPSVQHAGSPRVIDAQTFVIATSGGDGVFRSTDAGESWTKVSPQSPCQPIVEGPDGTWIYSLYWNRGLIYSQDQGTSWAQGTGYGVLDFGLGEGRSGTFIGDGRLVWIRMLTKSGDQQLLVSSDYKTFANFLTPFPVTQLDSPDQTLGVVYSKPANKLYTYTRYGVISRWDL